MGVGGSWHRLYPPTQGTVCSPPTSPSSLSASASEVVSAMRATGKVGRVIKVGVWPPREVRQGYGERAGKVEWADDADSFIQPWHQQGSWRWPLPLLLGQTWRAHSIRPSPAGASP